MARFFTALCFFCASACAWGFAAQMLAGSMDNTFYSSKGAVFSVSYKSLDVLQHATIMKVSVPVKVRLNNLAITAFSKNITQAELDMAQTKLPFTICAAPFSLKIEAKKSVVFCADTALLTPINTIYLKGNVRLVGDNAVKIGDEAFLSLSGRSLLLSFSGRKIAFKF